MCRATRAAKLYMLGDRIVNCGFFSVATASSSTASSLTFAFLHLAWRSLPNCKVVGDGATFASTYVNLLLIFSRQRQVVPSSLVLLMSKNWLKAGEKKIWMTRALVNLVMKAFFLDYYHIWTQNARSGYLYYVISLGHRSDWQTRTVDPWLHHSTDRKLTRLLNWIQADWRS